MSRRGRVVRDNTRPTAGRQPTDSPSRTYSLTRVRVPVPAPLPQLADRVGRHKSGDKVWTSTSSPDAAIIAGERRITIPANAPVET